MGTTKTLTTRKENFLETALFAKENQTKKENIINKLFTRNLESKKEK